MASASEVNTAESLRIRNVRQYAFLRHGGSSSPMAVSSSKITSSDTALTAFTQLVTWRLDAQRAIVSLVDRDNQYFLAESTPTLDLGDADQQDTELWMGCSGSTTRENALCANTITASQSSEKPYALFWVPDLSKNPQFSSLPYVANAPFFKFYAGTPLVTRDGSRIGSLFVIDDRAREDGLSESEIDFLGLMSKNVMQYLDMQRESEQRKRSTVMSKGLAAFIEGQDRIPPEWTAENDAAGKGVPVRYPAPRPKDILLDDFRRSRGLSGSGNIINEARKGSPGFQQPRPKGGSWNDESDKGANSHQDVLTRAANLLRESLGVDYTVLFDTTLMIATDGLDGESGIPQNYPHSSISTQTHEASTTAAKAERFRRAAAILSFSTKETVNPNPGASVPFNTIEHRFIQYLLRKYPTGSLWSFDESGELISSEGDPLDLDDSSSASFFSEEGIKPGQDESISTRVSKALSNGFPGARQVLFAPIYDSGKSQDICACFAVSLKEVPVFTTEIEVAFVRAFLNSVAAEYDRVSAKMADRQKGDFISSISHEFRTPLHGILASTALLADSELASPQKNLCETIDSCGRTLLYTVSHILDYTKVNNFSSRSGSISNEQRSEQQNSSSLHIYSTVNVATICEEAVHVVSEGHRQNEEFSSTHSMDKMQNVSIEISPGDWMFTCTPGAVQRILMNLFGNSLKFTKTGYVSCKIHTYGSDPVSEDSMVRIVVIDTGIGISDDFLKFKLYTPFSQESSLSAGTGLGLSIVKKIVNMLGGTIRIQSEIGHGTKVTVDIPLIQATYRPPQPQDPISLLQSGCKAKRVALSVSDLETNRPLRDSLECYITKWYHMIIVDDATVADFIIVNEKVPDDLVELLERLSSTPRIIVASSIASKDCLFQFGENHKLPLHRVSKPVGPIQLAKVMLACWEEGEFALEPSSSAVIKPSPGPEEIAADVEGDWGTVNSTVVDESSLVISSIDANKDQSSVAITEPLLIEVALPIRETRPDEAMNDRTPSFEKQLGHNPTRLQQPQILCVDDNAVNLKVLQAYLKKLKYTNIKCVINGLEALQAVEGSSEPFDIIFMDLSMPICDGFESTQLIRKIEYQQQPPRKPANIIALTGLAADRDQTKAYMSGMDYFVTKPLSLVHLKELLEEWEMKGRVERRLGT